MPIKLFSLMLSQNGQTTISKISVNEKKGIPVKNVFSNRSFDFSKQTTFNKYK